jgi:site-specific DNA-cytosine methylase
LVTLPEQDVRLLVPHENVHGILAAPPCTEFSFAKHYHGKGNYSHDFLAGLSVVDACLRIIQVCKPVWWAMENPKGYLRRWLGEPIMTFDPWQFGDPYQKKTDLWGEFAAPKIQEVEKPGFVKKFSLLRSAEIVPEQFGLLSRTERRAMTPPGFAQAFFEANP